MKLFLVRHGETEENVAGILMGHHHGVLTEKGKKQAEDVPLKLKDYTLSYTIVKTDILVFLSFLKL